jgi:hypothetical protein
MDRISRFAGKLGGKLGVAVCALGFVAIFLGWNGAASFNDLRQQFPYLVSGGVAGLALVMVGVALLLVEAMRAERAELQAALLELRTAIESAGALSTLTALPALAPEGTVVAGASSYHRPSCRLVEGRDDLDVLAEEEAVARGLSPCRICTPDVAVAVGNGSGRRGAKAR